MNDLPKVNQRVSIAVDGAFETLSSRVEDVGDGWLALAPPSRFGRTQWLRSGTAVTVQWITSRGLGVVHGIVRGSANLGVRTFVVELIGGPEVVQRRRHVRADTFVRIVVTPALPSDERQPAIGTTLDVAGGGLRARAPGWLDPGDMVRVRIMLEDDQEVSALARVVRRIDEETVAFEFEDIGVQERERLVRHVFRRLRKALVARDG